MASRTVDVALQLYADLGWHYLSTALGSEKFDAQSNVTVLFDLVSSINLITGDTLFSSFYCLIYILVFGILEKGVQLAARLLFLLVYLSRLDKKEVFIWLSGYFNDVKYMHFFRRSFLMIV